MTSFPKTTTFAQKRRNSGQQSNSPRSHIAPPKSNCSSFNRLSYTSAASVLQNMRMDRVGMVTGRMSQSSGNSPSGVDAASMSCPTCGKAFTTLSKYRAHKTYHKKACSLACSYCDKQFRLKGDLIRHERVHTGERPYKCRYCDKRYKRTSTRRIHETSHMKHLPPL